MLMSSRTQNMMPYNCIQILLLYFFFFVVIGNDSSYTICMGLFCLWICIKQTKLEILASLPSKHWANSPNKCFTGDSADLSLLCHPINHLSTVRERKILAKLSLLHYSDSFPMQCVLNGFVLVSLVGLFSDNFIYSNDHAKTYKNANFTFLMWPLYVLG